MYDLFFYFIIIGVRATSVPLYLCAQILSTVSLICVTTVLVLLAFFTVSLEVNVISGKLDFLYAFADEKGIEKNVIKKIEIIGKFRLPSSTIINYAGLKNGDEYNTKIANEALRKIYASGLFKDVVMQYNGGVVTIMVQENPIVRHVVFEGNISQQDEDLNRVTFLEPRSHYSLLAIKRDTENIIMLYNKYGWFGASVVPKIVKVDDDRVDVIFVIHEGKRAKINKILFIGNKSFKSDVLRDALSSKESRWYMLFSSSDLYDREKIEKDRIMLKKYYFAYGYLDAKIVDVLVEASTDKGSFFITFVVDEGKQYKISKISLENKLKNIKDKDIWSIITCKVGDIASQSISDGVVDNIKYVLGTMGYAFCDVTVDSQKNKKTQTAELVFKISEGHRRYIRRINILDNDRTIDDVIRYRMLVAEGDAYAIDKIDFSKSQIMRSGYFEDVSITPEPTDDIDRVDLNVRVKERRTAELHLNGGYVSNSGIFGEISLSDPNVLGSGQGFNVNYKQGGLTTEIGFDFVNPHFKDRDILFGFGLSYNSQKMRNNNNNNSMVLSLDDSRYQKSTIAGNIRFGYNLSHNLSQMWQYSLDRRFVGDMARNLSPLIMAEPSLTYSSYISHQLAYDVTRTRRSFEITDGFLLKMVNTLSGIGGDTRYIKTQLQGEYYHSFGNTPFIAVAKGRWGNIFGWGDSVVSIYDNFFVGEDYIRGFSSSGIGPRDKTSKDALGSKLFYSATGELQASLFNFQNDFFVKAAVFIDVANAYSFDLPKPRGGIVPTNNMYFDENFVRVSCGAGIIVTTPIGRIRLDYGVPIRETNFDIEHLWRISFGVNS